MRPFNFDTIEAIMHDKLAESFAAKQPSKAKLGAIPVCLITLVSKPLFALASLIEAFVCFLINLISLCSAKSRKDLGESMANLSFKILSFPFCPLTTLFQAIHRTVQIAQDPIQYKETTAMHRGSVEALRNDRAGIAPINQNAAPAPA